MNTQTQPKNTVAKDIIIERLQDEVRTLNAQKEQLEYLLRDANRLNAKLKIELKKYQ